MELTLLTLIFLGVLWLVVRTVRVDLANRDIAQYNQLVSVATELGPVQQEEDEGEPLVLPQTGGATPPPVHQFVDWVNSDELAGGTQLITHFQCEHCKFDREVCTHCGHSPVCPIILTNGDAGRP